MKQLSLFDESSPYRVNRVTKQKSLVMDKEAFLSWKQRIYQYQQSVRNTKPAQQQSLFDLSQSTGHSADDIDPFILQPHPADFYRTPRVAEPLDETNQGVIYFIIDRHLPILLYVGESKLSAHQRWSGVHDAKDYLMRYIELH